MNELFGYTGGTILIFFFLALVVASILISIFAKRIWVAKDEKQDNKGGTQ